MKVIDMARTSPDHMAAAERRMQLRRQANQIVAQLPEDPVEAEYVLAAAGLILKDYISVDPLAADATRA